MHFGEVYVRVRVLLQQFAKAQVLLPFSGDQEVTLKLLLLERR